MFGVKEKVKTLQQLLKILKPLIPHMILTISLGTMGYLAISAITLAGGMAVLELMGFPMDAALPVLLGIVLAAGVLRAIFRLSEQYMTHYIAFRLLAVIRDHIFTALRRLGHRQLKGMQKGELMNVITKDVELLEVFYAHTVAPVCIGVVTTAVYFLVFWSFHPLYAGLALLAYIVIGVLVPRSVYRIGQEAGEDYRSDFGRLSQFLMDRLRGLKELYIFGQEKKTLEEIDAFSEKLNDSTLSLKKHEGLLKALTDAALYASIFLQITLSVYLAGEGHVNAGTALLAILLLFSSFGPALALSQLSASLVHTFASAKRVLGILHMDCEAQNNGELHLANIDQISYHDVGFGYGEDILYEHVNMEWNKGEIIGIKGDNGVGKSTLISLLLGEMPVSEGTILVNGIPLWEYDQRSFRDHFSMVDANTVVFSDTLRRNLTVYQEDYEDDEILSACEKAGLLKLIETLPEGLDTHIQEFGDNLSSGQLQRLSLARLFLKDASVFILDEPTTNLDAWNESSILQAVKRHAKDKFVLLISHNDSVLAMADRVFEVKAGTITETGKFNCLEKNA